MNKTSPTPWVMGPERGIIEDARGLGVADIFDYSNWEANGQLILRAVNAHDELVASLTEMTPPMPPRDARCHIGICAQIDCSHCQRIARAHAALAKVKP